jgi:WD40 repeat protein
VSSTDERASDGAETARAAEPTPAAQPSGAAPTFPAEAESLLAHLKLGARTPRPADAPPELPNYAIECELGRGGMGVVYRARHRTLHHRVAVKMILAADRATPAEVARFLAEAEASAAVRHPNVVPVFDLGCADGRPYLVLEYVPGGTLAARLKSGPLAPRAAAELLEPVARGVQAAHDAGIVHRDLKPGNVLLAHDRPEPAERADTLSWCATVPVPGPDRPAEVVPKVSDFGLAKRFASDLTRSQAVMGTPQYMAPEQAGGRAKFVGPAADVYALGVILYECLTGAVPFDSADPWAQVRRVLEDRPEPPRRRAPGVPRDLELICLTCLEKEPHHRYPTAAALADDLRRFLDGRPVSVRPIGPIRRAARWARRRPAAAALVALLVVLAFAVPALLVAVSARLDQIHEREAAAHRLAEERELFGLRTALRTRTATRPAGWTAANRADLVRAVPLAAGEALVELRSVAAGTILTADLDAVEPVVAGLSGSALATDPNSGLVAVGEFKAWGKCRVRVFDPATGAVRHRLWYWSDILWKYQDGTRALAFSPDGKRLFVGTRGSKVHRFDLDAAVEKPAKSWAGSGRAVDQLAVSPDGKTVYGLCRPEVPVFAWDADTGAARGHRVPNENAPVTSFAVLPSGDVLASNGHALYRWAPDGRLVSARPNRTCFRLAATDGPAVLVADGPRLTVHDRDSGAHAADFPDPGLRRAAHEEYVRTIVVHPCGAYAATAAGDRDRTVKVWELASGRLIGTVHVSGTETIAVAWSADGRFLLATAEERVERWAFRTSAAGRFACRSGFPLAAATLAPDGRVAAVGAHGAGGHDVFLGTPDRGAEVVRVLAADGGGEPGVAVARDGTLAVTLHQPGVRVWKPGAAVPEAVGPAGRCPRFTPCGTLWRVANSNEVHFLDPTGKHEPAIWKNDAGVLLNGVSSIDALAAGSAVTVAAGLEGVVFVFDARTGRLAAGPADRFKDGQRAKHDPILAVALAPDESFAVAGTQNGDLRVVRLADRTEPFVAAAHPGGTTAVSVSRNGTLLATGGRDCAVRLWRRADDGFEPLFAAAHLPGVVRELQFGASDDRLLVLLSNEHAVRIWDVGRLKEELVELGLGW